MLAATAYLFPLLLMLPSGTHQSESLRGETMGTTYTVLIETDDVPFDPAALQSEIDARLVAINKMMSTYDPESELSRFNASDNTEWFPVSPETAQVVQRALEISEMSNGAFDPTVGELVRMWSFGPDHSTETIPTDEEIADALKSVGYQKVSVRLDPPALKKDLARVDLDLSAIAKGYAVDAVSEYIDQQISTASYMVEIGGEVRTHGSFMGHGWRLGIERPSELNLNRVLNAKVELSGESLATSGDYRNYFEKNGIKYSHTIHPQTGMPVTHTLASASVIADDCMTADAMATTLMVLGPEAGLEFANTHELSAYFITRDGEEFTEVASNAGASDFVVLPETSQPNAPEKPASLLTTFLITLSVFGIAIIGLAAGTLLSNKDLKGSCGGVEGTTDDEGKSICELCTTPPEECDRLKEEIAKAAQQNVNH